ncbi:MAG: DUF1801 domain-containing protein [Pyrinomonadaceae bacterium]|nr:DUF1801 domain-containing protein [Pyrinomonadaceae bacterium]MBP6212527.1 DUF1801 domain-containing protein [Pyrinomonadaceae bacterium]
MREKAQNVDAYIAEFPHEIAAKLDEMRALIKKLAPEAAESISYAIPTYKLNGTLVHFAGYANHIGFYPGAGGIAEFADELTDFKTSKGTVQFPLDRPLPNKLIAKIVKFRIKQNLEKKEK